MDYDCSCTLGSYGDGDTDLVDLILDRSEVAIAAAGILQ